MLIYFNLHYTNLHFLKFNSSPAHPWARHDAWIRSQTSGAGGELSLLNT